MEEAVRIIGGKRLRGTVKIDGSKNAALALIPAALLSRQEIVLENVPHIDDVAHLKEILVSLNVGVKADQETLTIDARNIINRPLTGRAVQKLRASYYFMGALIALFDQVEVAQPGGCRIGSRPIDMHQQVFEELGLSVSIDQTVVIKRKNYRGAKIKLTRPSVGATINALLAAVGAPGTTIIEGAAREVEVVEVARLINNMGGSVFGAGSRVVRIEGNLPRFATRQKIIPDRIEAGTYLLIGAALGDIQVTGIVPQHLKSLFQLFNQMGIKYQLGNSVCRVISGSVNPISIATAPYPGFPTDLQQPLTTLLTKATGVSKVRETIYPDRLAHVAELAKMGAHLQINGNQVVIAGNDHLKGARLSAKDLRGGAALLLAGMMAEGETILTGIEFIKRGYGNFITKLNNIGADISLLVVDNE